MSNLLFPVCDFLSTQKYLLQNIRFNLFLFVHYLKIYYIREFKNPIKIFKTQLIYITFKKIAVSRSELQLKSQINFNFQTITEPPHSNINPLQGNWSYIKIFKAIQDVGCRLACILQRSQAISSCPGPHTIRLLVERTHLDVNPK